MKKEGIQTRKRKPKAQTPHMKPMGNLMHFSVPFQSDEGKFIEKILPPMLPSQIQMPHHDMHIAQPHEHYVNGSQAHLRHVP
jgi:hypothetical protein